MTNALLESAKTLIRTNRRNPVLRALAGACEKYLHSFYNEDFYDFSRNGESFVIETFSTWFGQEPGVVWDVGANCGQWAMALLRRIPYSRVTSFEIVPQLAAEIVEAAARVDNWQVEPVGLSNQEGMVEVVWNRTDDTTNSLAPDLDSNLFANAELERIQCPVTTIDAYWQRHGIAPDFLKIDAEGHDGPVLEGATALLGDARAPAIIQFEYGHTWIPAHRLLQPVQRQLEQFGYAVGRLYPNHVDFRPFRYRDEHFRMGNMIAVKDQRLRGLLTGNGL